MMGSSMCKRRQGAGYVHPLLVRRWWLLALSTVLFSGCVDDRGDGADLRMPVRYELAGKRYEVPLAYHYNDALKRRNRWPNPKREFSRVGAISITALVPGLMPFDESVRSEFEQRGHGNKIHILIQPPGSLYPMEEWLRRMNSTGSLKPVTSDLDGLIRYWDSHTGQDESKGDDVYIREGKGYFMLRCPRVKAPSPGCSVTKIGRHDLEIHYTFSRRHLGAWQDIERGVDARIDEFRVK